MITTSVLADTEQFVFSHIAGRAGHDAGHINRTRRYGLRFAAQCNADLNKVDLMLLLHDIGDWKFTDGDIEAGPTIAQNWLRQMDVPEPTIAEVTFFVANHSFRGGTNLAVMETLEQQIALDADSCDRLGAAGVIRAGQFGDAMGRSFFNGDLAPIAYATFAEFRVAMHQETTFSYLRRTAPLILERIKSEPGLREGNQLYRRMMQVLDWIEDEWKLP